MPSWVIAVIGLSIVSALVFVTRTWGKMAAENRVLKRTIEAAKTRKQIDHEVEKLTPDELATRLRDIL